MTTAVNPPSPKAKALTLDPRTRGLLRRFLADWVWPRRRQLVPALLLTGLLAAATGSYPKAIQLSFDTLMQPRIPDLVVVLAAIVGLTALRSLLLYFQTVATNRIVIELMTDMQKRAYTLLVTADFARLTREAPGQLVSRLTNDIAFIQTAVQAALNTVIRDTLVVIALVIAMFALDWVMSLIVLCIYPLAALPIKAVSDRLRRVAKRTQVGLGDMTSLLTETLSSARLIKTYRLEGYAAEKAGGSFEEVLRLRLKAVRSRARLEPVLEAIGGVAVAGVVALAYWRVSSGISSVGDFTGFVFALLMAAQPVRGLGNLSARVQEGLAAAERIYELIDERPKIVDAPHARPLIVRQGEIAFDNVAFSYKGNGASHAVRNFTLTVPGGAMVALVGRSGAGKSTLVNLVPRLFDVDEGRITIDGQDVRDVTLASLRGAIASVSQDITLFDDTIRANIALGRLGATEPEIVAAAQAAAAHGFILGQRHGYDTRIGDQGMTLSGGQRQRIALARAILKDAPILLLDEATSALDTESEQLVKEALARFRRNRTTLVIAHRLSTVQSANLICVMEDGAAIETGTHGELLSHGGAYARLAGSGSEMVSSE